MAVHRTQRKIIHPPERHAHASAQAERALRPRGGSREPRTVLLARDPVWLQAVRRVLQSLRIEVVGTTKVPERALTLVSAREPDLLIADIGAVGGGTEGVEFLRHAKRRSPALTIVALSSSDDREVVTAALAAGASAYVHKRTDAEDIALAIRQLRSPSIHLADGYRGSKSDRPPERMLSRREREVVRLLTAARTTREIARALEVTEQTVKFHLRNIYKKLGVSDRKLAARWALDNGLVESDEAPPAESE
jgi:DNA-binding NarL/FixJ family response regulator